MYAGRALSLGDCDAVGDGVVHRPDDRARGDGLPVVAGLANVYEATVQMRVVWAESGEVVHQDFTTATCGTGCWGTFEFTLDIPGLEQGQLIQVFWGSPEDGSDSDVVTYPVGPSGAPWDFFPDSEE